MLNAIRERIKTVGLELHPQKTKIVYCRDYRRKGKYPINKFDFLGYSFQPRTTTPKKSNRLMRWARKSISVIKPVVRKPLTG